MPAFAASPTYSLQEMRAYREESRAPDANMGDMRGYKDFFQAFIDLRYPLAARGDTSKWKYKADDMDYSWVDLNGDGVEDPILEFSHPAECGTAGCDHYVFFMKQGKLEYMSSLFTIAVDIGKPVVSGVKSIYGQWSCLMWSGTDYNFISGNREKLDGLDPWGPHDCGHNYNKSLLKFSKECQECHNE